MFQLVLRAEEAEAEVRKLKRKVSRGCHVIVYNLKHPSSSLVTRLGGAVHGGIVAACFPAAARLHPVPSVPPQNEKLLEDVDFYRYEVNNNDMFMNEKVQKKLSSANRHLEQCLDDLQVPLVDSPLVAAGYPGVIPFVLASKQKMKTRS